MMPPTSATADLAIETGMTILRAEFAEHHDEDDLAAAIAAFEARNPGRIAQMGRRALALQQEADRR